MVLARAGAVAVAVLLGHETTRGVGVRTHNYCCCTSSTCLCAFCCCMTITYTGTWHSRGEIGHRREVEPTQVGQLGLAPRGITRSVGHRRTAACLAGSPDRLVVDARLLASRDRPISWSPTHGCSVAPPRFVRFDRYCLTP